jgi:hypothetical protein
MNEKQGFDFKAWFRANGGLVRNAVLILVVVLSLFTNLRVSDVADDVDKTLEGPLVAYLPEEVQAVLDGLQAEWDGLAPVVTELEEILGMLDEVEAQGITNFDQLKLLAKSTTPVLEVDQLSTGNILQLEDSGSIVFSVADGGAVTQVGAGTVTGNYTVNGNLVVTGTSDLQGNVSSSTGVLTVTDNILVDGQADAIQLQVQGYTTQTSSLVVFEQSDGTDVWNLNNSGQLSSANGAVSVIDDFIVDGQADTDQLTVQGYTTQTNDLQTWEQSDGTDVATMTNAGALDVASTVNYGTDNLYPLGYASSGQQIECGVTATFTDTTAVTASALTTATYVIAIQITDPAATASILTVDAPAANVFNLDSWESDFTVGTTGITAYWCAIGNQ